MSYINFTTHTCEATHYKTQAEADHIALQLRKMVTVYHMDAICSVTVKNIPGKGFCVIGHNSRGPTIFVSEITKGQK